MRVDDASVVGSLRRAVSRLAEDLGFDEHRIGELAIAATELATNAHLYGSNASVMVRRAPGGEATAIELLVVDTGPGVVDVAAVMEDGVSTGGTLGIGLGAIRRLASRFEMYSVPGRGTVTVAVFAGEPGRAVDTPVVDGVTRPITGESVCGDAWAYFVDDALISVVVADGLGHGLLAAQASAAAIEQFRLMPDALPSAFLTAAHRALAGTRGAAVSMIRLDRAERVVRFAGVGNVTGRIVGDGAPVNLAPQPGIVGHHMRKVRDVEVAAPRDALVVLHSDGLTAKWGLEQLGDARFESPTVVGAVLLREAGIRHDDAGIAVLRVP
jgi:anti-sigma regulatory factor (Ser/Thr protein kinase)